MPVTFTEKPGSEAARNELRQRWGTATGGLIVGGARRESHASSLTSRRASLPDGPATSQQRGTPLHYGSGDVPFARRRAASLADKAFRAAQQGDRAQSHEWSTEKWLSSFDLGCVLAPALLAPLTEKGAPIDNGVELAFIKSLEDQKMVESLLAAALPQLAGHLLIQAGRLRKAEAVTAHSLATKFQLDHNAFTLQYGSADIFTRGLDAVVGRPSPQVRNAMEAEHTSRLDSQDKFDTPNYGVSTSSEIEWLFVTDPMSDKTKKHLKLLNQQNAWLKQGVQNDWPKEAKARPHEMRKAQPLSDLQVKTADRSKRLAALGCERLQEDEVCAARLYTGSALLESKLASQQAGCGCRNARRRRYSRAAPRRPQASLSQIQCCSPRGHES